VIDSAFFYLIFRDGAKAFVHVRQRIGAVSEYCKIILKITFFHVSI